jgi:hypothetical protein
MPGHEILTLVACGVSNAKIAATSPRPPHGEDARGRLLGQL